MQLKVNMKQTVVTPKGKFAHEQRCTSNIWQDVSNHSLMVD